MFNAAWFSLLVFAAALAGGPGFRSVQSAGAPSAALTLSTETPATMPPEPTPTPEHNPPPRGGIGGGGNTTPTCPPGYALEADGNCHRFIYTGGHYYSF